MRVNINMMRTWLHSGRVAYATIDGRRVRINRVRARRGIVEFELYSPYGTWIDAIDIERIEFERHPGFTPELAAPKESNTPRVNRYNEKKDKEAK